MNTSFLSGWRWRLAGWITALVLVVLWIYVLLQLLAVLTGGGA
jgi:hypothetical protein